MDKLLEIKIYIDFSGEENQLNPIYLKLMLSKIWEQAKKIQHVFSIQLFVQKDKKDVIQLEPWFKDEHTSFAELELILIKPEDR